MMYSYARLHNCVDFSHILLPAWNAAIAKSNNESLYSSIKIFMARVEAILLSRSFLVWISPIGDNGIHGINKLTEYRGGNSEQNERIEPKDLV
jgi:hypothetical protein